MGKMTEAIVIHTAEADAILRPLEGRMFQVHVLQDGSLRLYPVTIKPDSARCPATVCGERCGLTIGHDGKHQWAGGD